MANTKTKSVRQFALSIAWVPYFLGVGAAQATVVKSVQFTGPDAVEIMLDQKIDKSKVQTEFVRDIIQLSLDGASIYPARIAHSNQSPNFQKIFSYQFSPRTVRIRLSTKQQSEQFRGRLKVEVQGRTIRARLIAAPVAKVTAAPGPVEIKPYQDSIAQNAAQTVSDPELLKKIVDSKDAKKPKKDELFPHSNPVSSFRSVMIWMILFVAGLGVLALGIKATLKAIKQGPRTNSKVAAFLARGLARVGLSTNKKLIEVVANHHLGPKKTISVVKVQGRMLVLGISNDSISLITELTEGMGATSAGLPKSVNEAIDFDMILGEAQQAPTVQQNGVRDRIRAKLERLKPL